LVIGHLGSDRINYSRCSPQLRRIGWNDASCRRAIRLHSARLRQISFILIWLDRFTVIQTGVIAAIAVTFANYAAIFFPVLENAVYGWY
jgi:hypothetical protein